MDSVPVYSAKKNCNEQIPGISSVGSWMEMYSKSLSYWGTFLHGFAQAGVYLVGAYGKQADTSFASHPLDGKTVVNGIKSQTESYLLSNADSLLRSLLEFMSLFYSSNEELRKHIRNFKAKYQFQFRDHPSPVAAEITDGRIRVSSGLIPQPDICLTFRNSRAFIDLFFSSDPDMLGALLKQDIVFEGNITYIYKFVYLLRHLQNKLLGPV